MNSDTLKGLDGRYCNSLNTYSRWLTREVKVGDVPLGAHHPIRIQSMTTTDTMDTLGTVEQSIRMIEAGCEYIRITAPSIKEAQNLAEIKRELHNRGYHTPLVADIHFTPNAAEVAARIVEKVRVNPGNYADKKKFDQLSYTPSAYEAELERIHLKFSPLVKICKEYGTAMRIGTNHGSLSDRIMSQYGDTPEGMVESAMEFIRICEFHQFYNLVISMKSSNPQVMVQAYRLLVETMVKEGMNYPLHLGVTEAGDGEDGRIKSAVGIGTLLEDGLGDTVRVSLTEDPEFEAPVAKALVDRYTSRSVSSSPITTPVQVPVDFSPYAYQRRTTYEANAFIGGHMVPRVFVDLSHENLKDPAVLNGAGYLYAPLLDKYHMADQSVDFVYLGDKLPSFNLPGNLKQLYNYTSWRNLKNRKNCHPVYSLQEYIEATEKCSYLNLVIINTGDEHSPMFQKLSLDNTLVFILKTSSDHGMAAQRQFFFNLMQRGFDVPVIIKRTYPLTSATPDERITQLQLYAATDMGGLLVDGLGDGIWIEAPTLPIQQITSTSFVILQATRSRISKTEYISCPSCGRTLFDLQQTTQMIRSRTSHLKGLKIAVMGCIVNGPGEMADADYGYVGAGIDKITLYRGKEVIKKNISKETALNELIGIIQEDGNWVEP